MMNQRFSILECVLFALMFVSAGQVRAQDEWIPTSAITASASSEFYAPLTGVSLTIDRSGLTGLLHDNHPQGHTMWLSSEGGGGSALNNPAGVDGPAWLHYLFDTTYRLESIFIWNHNQQNLTDRGLRHVRLYALTPGDKWIDWGPLEIPEAPGTADYPPGLEVNPPDVLVRAVLLVADPVNGNHGSTFYGLSEIAFHGVRDCSPPDDYPVGRISISPETDLNELFAPQSEGWLGSDVAHSIPLSEDRILWLFGDTFVGTSSGGSRDGGAAFLNNTIGIQDIAIDGTSTVTFHWGDGNTSFIPHQPGTPGSYYWPTAGILLDDELYIFSYAVDSSPGIGFSIAGTILTRVANPEEEPADWEMTSTDFEIGTNNFNIHSAVYAEGEHVYFLGMDRRSGFPSRTILGRMTSSQLQAGATASSMEFWKQMNGSTGWAPGTSDLVPLFTPSNTEMTVQHVEQWDRYFVLTYDPFSPQVYITTAESLTGPWETPVCLFEVPEHFSSSFDIISYACRFHPEFSREAGDMVVSYATNTPGTLAPLFTTEGFLIYVPRFYRIQLELPGSGFRNSWMIY